MKKLSFFLSIVTVALLLLFLLACGGSSHPVNVSISPATSALLVNQTAQFTATVTGTSNTAVTWSVSESNGGMVSGGFYSAPWANGTYHVIATSVADPTKSASATVSVSAKFAFMEKLLNGTSQPWSVTPMLGTLGADGKFVATNVNDPTTGKPLDTPMYDVFLSSDGKKAVFTMATVDESGNQVWNIYTANSDGTGIAQLTHGTPGGFIQAGWQPQFSPDNQKIVYVVEWPSIYVMNADGSDQHEVYRSYAWAGGPSFSPDRTKIVFVDTLYVNLWVTGIVIMNADGTNVVPLTTTTHDPSCQEGYDEMPAFTNDGKQIAFSEVCATANGGTFETIYIMNTDGTNVTKLHGDDATFISCQPRAVGDRLVFSTNVDYPGTDQFEMYSIMPDGSNLTKLTNNALYDGFSIAWLNYYEAPSLSARHIVSPAQERIEHLRRLQERRAH